jgi:hypothetical protein
MVPVEPAIADQEVLRMRDQVVHDTMAQVVLLILVPAVLLTMARAVQHIQVPVDLATRGRADLAIPDRAAGKGVQRFVDEESLGRLFQRRQIQFESLLVTCVRQYDAHPRGALENG